MAASRIGDAEIARSRGAWPGAKSVMAPRAQVWSSTISTVTRAASAAAPSASASMMPRRLVASSRRRTASMMRTIRSCRACAPPRATARATSTAARSRSSAGRPRVALDDGQQLGGQRLELRIGFLAYPGDKAIDSVPDILFARHNDGSRHYELSARARPKHLGGICYQFCQWPGNHLRGGRLCSANAQDHFHRQLIEPLVAQAARSQALAIERLAEKARRDAQPSTSTAPARAGWPPGRPGGWPGSPCRPSSARRAP